MLDQYQAAALLRFETMTEQDRRRGDEELGRIVAETAKLLSWRRIGQALRRTHFRTREEPECATYS